MVGGKVLDVIVVWAGRLCMMTAIGWGGSGGSLRSATALWDMIVLSLAPSWSDSHIGTGYITQ